MLKIVNFLINKNILYLKKIKHTIKDREVDF